MGAFWRMILLACCTPSCFSFSSYTNTDFVGSVLYASTVNAPARSSAKIPVAVLLRRADGSVVSNLDIAFVAEGCTESVTASTNGLGVAQAMLACDVPGQHAVQVSLQGLGFIPSLSTALTLLYYEPADDGVSVASGTPLNVAVMAQAQGASVPDATYRGSIHFTSTDANATLPGDYIFQASDLGFKEFPGALSLQTLGQQTVSATDTLTGQVMSTVTYSVAKASSATPQPTPSVSPTSVSPPVASVRVHFVISSDVSVAAGTAYPIIVTALDDHNNIVTDYAGRVVVSSTDANALLPALPLAFTSRDSGRHMITPIVFNTFGPQTLTVHDTSSVVSDVNASVYVMAATGPHTCTCYGPCYMGAARFSTTPIAAMDGNDNPVLAWSDPGSGATEAYLSHFDGTAWQSVGAHSATGGGVSNLADPNNPNAVAVPLAVFVDPNGQISVGYRGYTAASNTSPSGLMYTYYEAQTQSWAGLNGSQTFPGIWGVSGETAYDTGVVMTQDGANPGVLWGTAQGLLQYRRWNGATWAGLTSSPTIASIVATPSTWAMALDSHGRPYVAYSAAPAGQYDIYMTHWDGSGWSELSGSNQGGGISNNAGRSDTVSIALDANDQPYVAWLDNSNLTQSQVYVAGLVNGQWTALGGSTTGTGVSDTLSQSGVWHPMIQVDHQGLPWVAWQQNHTSNAGDIYLRRYNGSAWEEIYQSGSSGGVSNAGNNTLWDPGFLLDSRDRPVFFWWIQGDNLRICHWL